MVLLQKFNILMIKNRNMDTHVQNADTYLVTLGAGL